MADDKAEATAKSPGGSKVMSINKICIYIERTLSSFMLSNDLSEVINRNLQKEHSVL